MNTSADVSKFQIVPDHVKCLILLKPVLGGVDGSLHLTVFFKKFGKGVVLIPPDKLEQY
jgi:hypothetical protein